MPTKVAQKSFLGVRYVNCNAYGRLYKNKEGTAYVGSCPRCGQRYYIPIGEGGTSSRFFLAHCS